MMTPEQEYGLTKKTPIDDGSPRIAIYQCRERLTCDTSMRPKSHQPKPGCGKWNVLRTCLRHGSRAMPMRGVCQCSEGKSKVNQLNASGPDYWMTGQCPKIARRTAKSIVNGMNAAGDV